MDLLNAIDKDAKEAFAAGNNRTIVSVAWILLLLSLFVCLEWVFLFVSLKVAQLLKYIVYTMGSRKLWF